jgi:hypothetical protein
MKIQQTRRVNPVAQRVFWFAGGLQNNLTEE